jgi:Protein kinase domain
MSQSIVRPLRRWEPERIGPYTIIGRLGAGAMGRVYLARSAAGRLVAVKTIRIELAEEPGFRVRFAREVAAASRVSGVFTAAVVASDADADLPWVATAYVPAPPLSALVRRCGPLPVPAVRWLAAGCAEALESIHGVGLLHRDIKPSNVLVAPDGPRVIDFGVARAAERVQLTVARGAAGTPAYMAPEQARDATQASPASDVFSLGATLVFAATGHPPYRGETVMDILVRLATEPPDLTGLPDELEELLATCLARVPRERPTDAAIIERLGPFGHGPGGAAAGGSGSGHGYLPDSAMELIAEYEGGALFPVGGETLLAAGAGSDVADSEEDEGGGATRGSGAGVASGDATSGSHTALPGFQSLAAAGPAPARAESAHAVSGVAASDVAGRRPGARGARWGRLRPAGRDGARPGPRRRLLVWTGRTVAAVALIAAGTALGLSLRGRAQAADPGPGSNGPQPCVVPGASRTAQVCVSQPYGDGDTVFVIHGSGFVPSTLVTVSLSGRGAAPYQPRADQQGTFSYAIDQGGYFFHGQPIPPGTYTAMATGTNGHHASAWFTVQTPPPPPPPAPPSGAPLSGAPSYGELPGQPTNVP